MKSAVAPERHPTRLPQTRQMPQSGPDKPNPKRQHLVGATVTDPLWM